MTQEEFLFGNGDVDHRRQEVKQAVKNACDQLSGDGVAPRDYVEQLAWLFFLKAWDELEDQREHEAAFEETPYERLLDGDYRWSSWTAKNPDQMLAFVNNTLWPKLTDLGDNPRAERFRRIFSTVKNHARRGASFARVVGQINRLHFSDETDVIMLSEIYEGLLKNVAQDSAGYAGEFYTQRHLIRAMIQVVRPAIGDRVYDPCFGSAGFLTEAVSYMRATAGSLSAADLDRLHRETFYGVEAKPLTYLLGTMNLLLHHIEEANLELSDTLERHTANAPEQHKYDVILSNPPFGGKMARTLQTNFTVKSNSTEILFLQHIMANLAKDGRAAVIVPEGVLFRGGPDEKVREKLLTEFDVHTVLSLPAGCFLPYTGVKTNVLFFNRPEDGKTTDSVWYYELTNDGFDLKQTRRPIEGSQIPDFLSKWETRVEGENSWITAIDAISAQSWDLSARNPNRKEEQADGRSALDLVRSIKEKESRIVTLLDELEEMLSDVE